MRKDIIILVVVIILCIGTVIGLSAHSNSEKVSHIYHEPGTCPHCGTVLEKTVNSHAYTSEVVWYCPKNNCPW